jgi:hypothetical protein
MKNILIYFEDLESSKENFEFKGKKVKAHVQLSMVDFLEIYLMAKSSK